MKPPKLAPSPWRAEGYRKVIVNSAEGITICIPSGGAVDATEEDMSAHAKAISALPTVLTALNKIVEDHEKCIKNQGFAEPLLDSMVDECKTALKEAGYTE